MVYFDHNATTPLLPEARQAWLEATQEFMGNPSSPHRLGARAETALGRAREELAGCLDCDPLDIVWTSGATESNNMVLHHLARTLPSGAEAWVSAIEHPCVLAPARGHFGERCRLMPVTGQGVLNLGWLEENLRRARPGFVAVMAANNETGVLQPWTEVLGLCRERQVPLVCDAVQWIGKLPAAGLGACDYLTGSAHKFGGPRGVGFVKLPPRARIHPLLQGGPQEEGRRAGTENVAAVLAMLAALRVRERQVRDAAERLHVRAAFEQRLLEALPGARVVGAEVPRLWNTVMALMPETDCRQRWVVKLDKLGMAVSTGSACSSGKEEVSHVLAAMGLAPGESSRALRFSSGWETTGQDWNTLLEALVRANREISRG